MKRYSITNILKLLVIFSAVYFSIQCTKVNHSLGGNIIPSKDELSIALDTVSGFEIYSKRVDSFQVDLFTSSYLGYYISPRLGKIDAAYTTELTTNIKGSSLEFTDDYVVDSVILSLAVSNPMGNINSNLKISMYELKENFRKPTNTVYREYASDGYFDPYYSNFDYEKYIKDTPYATFDINVTDATATGVVEIPLSKEIGERLLKMKPSDYEQDSTFRKLFKGFCFVAESSYAGGALMQIAPNESGIYINVYDNKIWEEEKEKKMVSISLDFGHISNNELYNQMVTSFKIDESYANTDLGIPENIINDSISGIDYSFVSGMGNVVTRLKFPIDAINDLKEQLIDSPSAAIIVTNATLELPTYDTNIGALDNSIYSLGAFYNFPTSVYMPDYYLNNSGKIDVTSFGGTLNRSFNKFEINITSYIQEVLSNKTNEVSIDITPSAGALISDRLTKLNNSDTRKIILKLTYGVAE